MAKYRKKPVEIDAIQWTGENQREMFDFLTNGEKKDEYMTSFGETFRIDHFAIKGGLIIKTLVNFTHVSRISSQRHTILQRSKRSWLKK